MGKKFALALILILNSSATCKKNSEPEEIKSPLVSADQIFLIVERVISGQFLNTSLSEPFGLAASRDGSVYVVDRGSNRVIKFNSEWEVEGQTGGYGLGSESFNRPTYVTVDNALNLFVSDENNRRVVRLDSRLNFVDDVKFKDEADPFKFGYPSGIGATSYGELWVGDRDKNRICLFNNVGKFDRFLGEFGSKEGQLSQPEKIVTYGGGKFYVCDAGHSRILVYDEYGTLISQIASDEFDYPISLAIEKDALWVLDGAASFVLLIDRNGRVQKKFGPMLPGDQTALNKPSDIILMQNGRLLISDSANRRLLLCRIERGESR